MQTYRYKAYEPGVEAHIVDMAVQWQWYSARVLKIGQNTVTATLKKASSVLERGIL